MENGLKEGKSPLRSGDIDGGDRGHGDGWGWGQNVDPGEGNQYGWSAMPVVARWHWKTTRKAVAAMEDD